MIIWILAACILGATVIVGYYQGAVRMTFSLVGLIAALFLSMPFGKLFELILPVLGVTHPVILAMTGPVIAFIVISIAFKIGGFVVHGKIETYYKYLDSETRRLLYERMSRRVGVCVATANATIYIFLICLVIHVPGYFTYQFGGDKSDPFVMKALNFLAAGLAPSGMDRAIAPLNPVPEAYYDGSDILSDIYHTPLLQSRLATYPPFLTVAERQTFKSIGDDTKFQEFWQRQPPIREFAGNEKINGLIKNVELFNEMVQLVGSDLPDLRTYLMTGESPKYADEKILGRWKFSMKASMDKAQKRQRLNYNQKKKLMIFYRGNMTDAVLTASLDGKIKIAGPAKTASGSWKRIRAGKYALTTDEGESEATVDDNTLGFIQREIPIVFRKL